MALSPLPLSYCTNVHPGRSLAEVEAGIDEFTVPIAARLGAPLAAGLWLAAPVIRELLAGPDGLPRFRDRLARRGLTCHTLNAFPYGDFHSRRVKENVYLPDWADPRRLEYSIDCARVLAALLPGGAEGSISTMPLFFKRFEHASGHLERCIGQLLDAAIALGQIERQTGRLIRLAIEPEPLCRLETTPETIEFFEWLFHAAETRQQLDLARRHLAICYDVCHQAVEFENITESIAALTAAGVRLAKVHISCALQLDAPADNPEARRELARYVEERYLHQTLARARSGDVLREVDLTEAFALEPPEGFRDAPCWRIHFHVPVDAERLGSLATTRPELREALAAVARLDYAPHLEVETYTWDVLPGAAEDRAARLIDGLARELTATRGLLDDLTPTGPSPGTGPSAARSAAALEGQL